MKEYANVFYFKRISKIGGTEQFLYEIAKKYHDYDITIIYDNADSNQLRRLLKYVRCIKREKDKIYKCKKAFLNFNIEIINQIEAEEYIFVSHAIYQELGYKPPIDNPKLTGFIGVSQYSADKLEEYGKKIGLNIKAQMCYDPLTLEKVEKVPILVSACRLNDKTKGGQRTLKLIEALDRYCVINNRQYLWMIFTNETTFPLPSKNAVYMQPRVDVRPYIAMADWVIQLSNDMETYCYTANEAWGYGVPVIATPLSVLKEFNLTDNELLILDWDCENVDEIARQVFEKETHSFNYEIPKDNWDEILVNRKSTYKEEKEMKTEVKCIKKYFDNELKTIVKPNEEDANYIREVSRERADVLAAAGVVEIVKTIEEATIEKVEEPEKATPKKPRKKKSGK